MALARWIIRTRPLEIDSDWMDHGETAWKVDCSRQCRSPDVGAPDRNDVER